MPQGLSGDTGGGITLGGDDVGELRLVEQRVMNTLLTKYLGTNNVLENLDVLRNDEAVTLQIPTPLPGAGR